MTFLPTDQNLRPIAALRPAVSGGAHKITTGAASARNATPFKTTSRIVYVYATEDVFYRMGDSAVTATATDHFLPAGLLVPFSLGAAVQGSVSNIAFLQSTAAGTVYISEME